MVRIGETPSTVRKNEFIESSKLSSFEGTLWSGTREAFLHNVNSNLENYPILSLPLPMGFRMLIL